MPQQISLGRGIRVRGGVHYVIGGVHCVLRDDVERTNLSSGLFLALYYIPYPSVSLYAWDNRTCTESKG